FATREELLQLLRDLGEELGRPLTAKDIDARKGAMPSKSLYWHTFGSLTTALREAGFDVPVGEERLERAVEQGVELARRLKRLPKFADWAEARKADSSLMTEWQVYRMFDAHREQRSDAELLLPEHQAQRLLGELERSLRRREEELVAAAAGPKRPADAAGEDQLRPLLVEPRRRHRALELLERLRRAAAGALGEGEE